MDTTQRIVPSHFIWPRIRLLFLMDANPGTNPTIERNNLTKSLLSTHKVTLSQIFSE